MADSIGLADFVAQVKRELMRPDSEQVDGAKLLMLEEVELEIKVGVTLQASGGIEVKVLPLDWLGAKVDGSGKREDAHTVRVKFQPLLSHDQRLDELQRDPHWTQYVQASVQHTIKSLGPNSQRED